MESNLIMISWKIMSSLELGYCFPSMASILHLQPNLHSCIEATMSNVKNQVFFLLVLDPNQYLLHQIWKFICWQPLDLVEELHLDNQIAIWIIVQLGIYSIHLNLTFFAWNIQQTPSIFFLVSIISPPSY